jgi:hypothetical protein
MGSVGQKRRLVADGFSVNARAGTEAGAAVTQLRWVSSGKGMALSS